MWVLQTANGLKPCEPSSGGRPAPPDSPNRLHDLHPTAKGGRLRPGPPHTDTARQTQQTKKFRLFLLHYACFAVHLQQLFTGQPFNQPAPTPGCTHPNHLLSKSSYYETETTFCRGMGGMRPAWPGPEPSACHSASGPDGAGRRRFPI